MGKYMRKPKITCDVAVMEVVSPLGVRTRAKTLALQKLQPNSPPDTSSSYLQLRSRRLEKLLSPPPANPQHQNPSPRKTPNSRLGVANSGSFRSDSERGVQIRRDFEEETGDLSVEPSFGENNLEFEGRRRSTRESTPCSFIREQITAETPDSATGDNSSIATNRIIPTSNPTAQQIEEFFASAEKHQQRIFAEKYNFDVVNDVPLPGRYEWVKVEK